MCVCVCVCRERADVAGEAQKGQVQFGVGRYEAGREGPAVIERHLAAAIPIGEYTNHGDSVMSENVKEKSGWVLFEFCCLALSTSMPMRQRKSSRI